METLRRRPRPRKRIDPLNPFDYQPLGDASDEARQALELVKARIRGAYGKDWEELDEAEAGQVLEAIRREMNKTARRSGLYDESVVERSIAELRAIEPGAIGSGEVLGSINGDAGATKGVD